MKSTAQETFLIIINVENSCYILCKPWYIIFRIILWIYNKKLHLFCNVI